MRSSSLVLAVSVLSLAACGGAKPPAEAPDSESTSPEVADAEVADEDGGEASAEAEDEGGIPTKCVDQHGTCVPNQKWVDRLCQDSYPGVTMVMFEKSSPWTRGYMRAKTEAHNASGGLSGEGFLIPGEEVIILRVRQLPEGGMQVSGAGGWDVLRWDGTCATVASGEMGLEPFGELKAAKVTYRFIDDSIREALRADDAVTEAYRNRRKHCRGATMGEVSAACETWDAKLAAAVVSAVRNGIDLPDPDKLP
jgi:predicted small lipoprotein YifL